MKTGVDMSSDTDGIYGLVPQRVIDEEDEKLRAWKQDTDLVSDHSSAYVLLLVLFDNQIKSKIRRWVRCCGEKNNNISTNNNKLDTFLTFSSLLLNSLSVSQKVRECFGYFTASTCRSCAIFMNHQKRQYISSYIILNITVLLVLILSCIYAFCIVIVL